MAAKCVERNIDVIKKSTPMSTKARNKAHCAQTCAGWWGVFLPIKLLFHVFVEKILFITLTNRSFNTGDIFICEWVHRNHSSKCIWKDQPLGLFVFTADGLLVKKKCFIFETQETLTFSKDIKFRSLGRVKN